MNRKEIKEEAKIKIKGNKWNIWWPVLVIGFVTSIVESLFGVNNTTNIDFNSISQMSANFTIKLTPVQTIGATLGALLSAILMACYLKYIINFVRTGKFNSDDILDTLKEKWLNIIVAAVLVSVIVGLCSLLFVIPGIIMALAYTVVMYLVVDTDVEGSEALKKSREMMKGHKWEYFVFQLSFIGWMLLVPFTLGLILIWLIPYMTTAQALYYEKLKSLN